MVKLNENYSKLPGSYLFAEIEGRVKLYKSEHPDADLISLGIGDVTMPLSTSVTAAMRKAVDEMGIKESFRGYGPYEGYEFLRTAIAQGDYKSRGVNVSEDEIFVSDGAKSDCGNIGDIFAADNSVAVCDPVYPVYVDTSAMAGRAGEYADGRWSKIIYMPCTADNAFMPELPKSVPDIIYLCFPNNPTGAAAKISDLKPWVDFALRHGSVILYDSAYEAYVQEEGCVRSIYEVEGARGCAIELRSFSKTAGFTGTRCAYTVIPKELEFYGARVGQLWYRRQSTKFNGVPYVIQRGAEAVYTEAGQIQTREVIGYYMANARVILDGLAKAGLTVSGGVNSPYVWTRTPDNVGSWEFFDRLLTEANVVTTPGAGFGTSGEGYVRITAFGDAERTAEAVRRIVMAL